MGIPADGWVVGNSLSRLYLRNPKVLMGRLVGDVGVQYHGVTLI